MTLHKVPIRCHCCAVGKRGGISCLWGAVFNLETVLAQRVGAELAQVLVAWVPTLGSVHWPRCEDSSPPWRTFPGLALAGRILLMALVRPRVDSVACRGDYATPDASLHVQDKKPLAQGHSEEREEGPPPPPPASLLGL